MLTTTDDFLKIGSTHRICQDYVLSGTEPFPFCILSDGCSSSAHTDVGARMLSWHSKRYLIEMQDQIDAIQYDDMGKWIIEQAAESADKLGINPQSLDATLILAYAVNHNVHVYVYGDGCILLKDTAGNGTCRRVRFSRSVPYYLSYELNPERKQAYRQLNLTKAVDSQTVSPDAPVYFKFSTKHYPLVIIASDGMDSFIDQAGTSHGIEKLLPDLTGFKTMQGAFVKRRFKRAIRDMEKNGLQHYDDISAGAFYSQS